MYGLINRSIQCFVEDTYGPLIWEKITRDARLDFRNFEAMLSYPDQLTEDVINAVCANLERDRASILEDLGTYMVTHENMEAVRRLLRFGGHTFEDFLESLDDLNDRVKLAVPDLNLPELELRQYSAQKFALICKFDRPGFGAVFLGILRALADDYGVLVLLGFDETPAGGAVTEVIHIDLLEVDFATGRSFSLSNEGVMM